MKFTNKKLINIVAFCALMENGEGIISKSLDYIIEKFTRYCSSDKDDYKWGLDSGRKKIVRDWTECWLKIRVEEN